MSKTFVLAPDSFKESMSAIDACHAMRTGIEKIYPDARFIYKPMADGGEGTIDALLFALQGEKVAVTVTGPLSHQRIDTYFGLIDEKQTAIIEMAKANGIDLLLPEQRNPLLTTTLGTGELIKAALDHGVKKIIIGLGGSVTNDGGVGMAYALGVRFYDQHGKNITFGGGSLHQIDKIDVSGLDTRLQHTEILIACDVNNPLIGKNGASYVFAPQKGANADMVELLEANMQHYANCLSNHFKQNFHNIAGAGAAGGLSTGLLAFTNAQISAGAKTIIQEIELEAAIAQADYVFTGEGGIDFQTQFGKTPLAVSQLAQRYQKPVFACAGYIGAEIDHLYQHGFSAIFGILDKSCDLETACQNGAKNLERTCENIARVLKQIH
ncbi:glycerate kinase [Acinetobacter sp. MD2(2019)]|uniref:glycerate kinase family protein n=1 Tax=Acinetobacter sp. MD2(2019) TaxID=2605273 RepID=UPI002D1F7204|nr:glycerate kinase [Acinetobacter sp. MD2(2019)]MEB3754875.1 glycerate kinase [Acinetobacter sp. MD2(2019)]